MYLRDDLYRININMRCIEIAEFEAPYSHKVGLTLT